MAEFETITEDTFRRAGARGRRLVAAPRAVSGRYDAARARVAIGLDTGVELSFAATDLAELAMASPEQLAAVEITGAGLSLHFPALDLDLSIPPLMEAFLGAPEWTRRQARAAASRENGKRGGRPRRPVAAE